MNLVAAINYNGALFWIVFIQIATLILGVNKGFIHGVCRGCFEFALAYMLGKGAMVQAKGPGYFYTSAKQIDLLIVTVLALLFVAITFKVVSKLFPKLVGNDSNITGFYVGYSLGAAIIEIGADFVG